MSNGEDKVMSEVMKEEVNRLLHWQEGAAVGEWLCRLVRVAVK